MMKAAEAWYLNHRHFVLIKRTLGSSSCDRQQSKAIEMWMLYFTPFKLLVYVCVVIRYFKNKISFGEKLTVKR